jgi:GAF domain-containing protein
MRRGVKLRARAHRRAVASDLQEIPSSCRRGHCGWACFSVAVSLQTIRSRREIGWEAPLKNTGLRVLVEEQAALRRVATLVARESAPEEVFAAVTDEVARLLDAEMSNMARYEPDGAFTIVGSVGSAEVVKERWSIGGRWPLGGNNTTTLVFETGRPARIDTFGAASGEHLERVREVGFRSAVAVPIIVEGRLWGVIGVATTRAKPLPDDTETRLSSFTELVGTAIANAESRAGLARLADEQAALHRIATLVAGGVPPEQVFSAVTEEVERLLPVDFARMERYEPDDAFTVLASAGSTTRHFPAGSRLSLGGKNVTTIVFETHSPARIDNYADHSSGPVGDTASEAGISSAVGAPIMVEGHLWGVIVVASTVNPSLPGDIEARLGSFTELVVTAIANAQSRADLTASRNGDPNVGELMAEALQHAEQANHELSELAHGILPSVLTREGLLAGVRALVSRMSLPVSVDVAVPRLPAGVEATAYFVVSEALTNVVKHANADRAEVMARVERGMLRIEVRDDGVGGARLRDSTGLHGLEDRVSALNGRLAVESSPGKGTCVYALLPVPEAV